MSDNRKRTSKVEVVMDELRELRQEINASLERHRDEHRSDVRDLHSKLDKKFQAISDQMAALNLDVNTHKVHIKTFSAMVSLIVGSISAWVITHWKIGS